MLYHGNRVYSQRRLSLTNSVTLLDPEWDVPASLSECPRQQLNGNMVSGVCTGFTTETEQHLNGTQLVVVFNGLQS